MMDDLTLTEQQHHKHMAAACMVLELTSIVTWLSVPN